MTIENWREELEEFSYCKKWELDEKMEGFYLAANIEQIEDLISRAVEQAREECKEKILNKIVELITADTIYKVCKH